MDIGELFREVAFPIAVSAYLLIVTTRRLEQINTSLQELKAELVLKLALLLDRIEQSRERDEVIERRRMEANK